MTESEPEFDAFVSYSRDDLSEVRYLIGFLERDYGLKIWYDKKIAPGDSWVESISSAIRSCNSAIICLRADRPEGFQKSEIEYLTAAQANNKSFKLIPVFLPGASPSELRAKIAFLTMLQSIDLTGGLSDLAQLSSLANELRRSKLVPVFPTSINTDQPLTGGLPRGYRADVEKVTSLLIGSSLYSYRDVCVRELVQNAFDACLRRRDAGFQYKTEIVFRINKPGGYFEVDDTGDGMSPHHLSTSFAIIGKSINQEQMIVQRALAAADERLNLIGKFGIGFISTFIICSKVVVSTQYEGADQINFSISDVTKQFEYTTSSECEREKGRIGTTIRVYLRGQYLQGAEELDLQAVVKRYCRHVPYFRLVVNGADVALADDWNIGGAEVFSENTVPRVYQSKLAFSSDLLGESARIIASNQGFFIEDNPDLILPKFTPGIVSGEINFFPGIVDVNVARDKIIRSETTPKLADDLARDIKSLFLKYLQGPSGLRDGIGRAVAPSKVGLFYDRNIPTTRRSLYQGADVTTILYYVMFFLKEGGDKYGDGALAGRPILDGAEATEFILGNWTLSVPELGYVPFRDALAYVKKSRDSNIYYLQEHGQRRLTDAERVFKEFFVSQGDVVIESSKKTISFADKSQRNVEEIDVLRALKGRLGFNLHDISTPTEKDLAKFVLKESQVPIKLAASARVMASGHKRDVKFTKMGGPAAFFYNRTSYINLANSEMKEYLLYIDRMDDQAVFTHLCGLLQMKPYLQDA